MVARGVATLVVKLVLEMRVALVALWAVGLKVVAKAVVVRVVVVTVEAMGAEG